MIKHALGRKVAELEGRYFGNILTPICCGVLKRRERDEAVKILAAMKRDSIQKYRKTPITVDHVVKSLIHEVHKVSPEAADEIESKLK